MPQHGACTHCDGRICKVVRHEELPGDDICDAEYLGVQDAEEEYEAGAGRTRAPQSLGVCPGLACQNRRISMQGCPSVTQTVKEIDGLAEVQILVHSTGALACVGNGDLGNVNCAFHMCGVIPGKGKLGIDNGYGNDNHRLYKEVAHRDLDIGGYHEGGDAGHCWEGLVAQCL